MPRTARSLVAGGCYHVINRGNNRATVFAQPADFRDFIRLLAQARERAGVSLFAACVMPNHFHLVVAQQAPDSISRWMRWLLTTHSHRHHLRHETSGRVWQGRFKAFPVQRDGHLMIVMRYVERNALRAGLTERAELWPWGSLAWRGLPEADGLLDPAPIPLPGDWREWVNAPQTPEEVESLRNCVNRQTAFGSREWIDGQPGTPNRRTPPRPRGRPRKSACGASTGREQLPAAEIR